METAVTVYELKENEELTRVPEAAGEWTAMVNDLGLEGQKKLLTKAQEGEMASPIPYLWMNSRLRKVFKTLCPTNQNIDEYDKMPIPILILGHVKQCQMKGWFKAIEVWYDDEKPDPVVVGIANKKQEEETAYLIGRWGAEDKSLEALSFEAAERRKAHLIHEANEKLSEVQKVLENPDKEVENYFADHYSVTTYW
jgi:hypothetical protein